MNCSKASRGVHQEASFLCVGGNFLLGNCIMSCIITCLPKMNSNKLKSCLESSCLPTFIIPSQLQEFAQVHFSISLSP